MDAIENGSPSSSSSSSDVSDENAKKGNIARRQVGEIFIVDNNNSYAIKCIHCDREFPFFYEFKQHVEEPCKERRKNDLLESTSANYQQTSISDQYDENVINKKLLPMEKALKLIQFRNPNEVRQLIEGSDYVKIGGKMKCVRCDKSIKCKRELRNHLTVIHGDKRKKNYKCPLCTRQFLLVEYVQRHLLNAHNIRYTIEMIRMSQPLEEQENSGWQSKLMVDSLKEQITLMTKRQAQLEHLLASGKKYTQNDIDKIMNDEKNNITQCADNNGSNDNLVNNDCTDSNMIVCDENEISASYSLYEKSSHTNEYFNDASTAIKTEIDLDSEDLINI